MSNNKQQMTVKMMWNEIDNLFPFKDSVEAQKFCAILDKYKEMEKERMINFTNDWYFNGFPLEGGGGDVEETIEQHYNKTYGGGE
jgi:hypothetical protein